ncbi:MAG TPA: response regulator transcription factor [Chloroflexi bacterium]|nr:response regulator transcription factor [Chloroflexota bacterium]
MSPYILLVEGRKTGRRSWAPTLSEKGYSVIKAHTRREALLQLRQTAPDLVVLDGRHLRFDVYRFSRTVRADGHQIPILLIVPSDWEVERGSGVNVHLREPFTARKLLNRIGRLLPSFSDNVLQVGDLVLDLQQRTVTRGSLNHRLTPKQARLLEVFMRHPGRVLTRRFLMEQVWETDFVEDTRTLEVHVHWLRKAIEDDPAHPVFLTTVRRVGYRFEIPPQTPPGTTESETTEQEA